MVKRAFTAVAIFFALYIAFSYGSTLFDLSNQIGTKERAAINGVDYGGNNITVTINKSKITATIVDTQRSREIGLSNHTDLEENKGMLFLFPSTAKHKIWMKDMNFPLDIIWISNSSEIVDIRHNVPICESLSCPLYSPAESAKYVLEVSAGWAVNNNVNVGDVVLFE